MSRYDFEIREVTREESLRMIRAYHYSDTLPRINRHFLGCFLDGEMVGTLTLGLGTRPRHTIQCLFPSLGTSDYYEIGRMSRTRSSRPSCRGARSATRWRGRAAT